MNGETLHTALRRRLVQSDQVADGTNPGLGTWRYYHMDAQGSAGLVTDPSHTGTAGGGCSRRRSPTGPTANGTPAPAARSTTNRQRHLAAHRYAQREWDPAVIQYYAPYRWYHPRLSRWTTRDPLGMVDGPNVSAYVMGDPVNAVDPMGLFLDDIICFLFGVYCDDDDDSDPASDPPATDPPDVGPTGGDAGTAATETISKGLAPKGTPGGGAAGGVVTVFGGFAGAAPGTAMCEIHAQNLHNAEDNLDEDAASVLDDFYQPRY